ncbi:MAG: hypothetical protein H6852_09615 [Geminicoccaceae bacterium]|nr:hypothetical protein [Geminicoccaceae bacterium]
MRALKAGWRTRSASGRRRAQNGGARRGSGGGAGDCRPSGRPATKKDRARVSTTDPEARVMKMADGGFRPAFNVQLAAETEHRLIVGVAVTTAAATNLEPMADQIAEPSASCRARCWPMAASSTWRPSTGWTAGV